MNGGEGAYAWERRIVPTMRRARERNVMMRAMMVNKTVVLRGSSLIDRAIDRRESRAVVFGAEYSARHDYICTTRKTSFLSDWKQRAAKISPHVTSFNAQAFTTSLYN